MDNEKAGEINKKACPVLSKFIFKDPSPGYQCGHAFVPYIEEAYCIEGRCAWWLPIERKGLRGPQGKCGRIKLEGE